VAIFLPISSSIETTPTPVSFFDTNVLVSLAPCDVAKADRAEALVAEDGTVSV
jgi:hypothetical protein